MTVPDILLRPSLTRPGFELVRAVGEVVHAANQGVSAEGLLSVLCRCLCDVPGVATASATGRSGEVLIRSRQPTVPGAGAPTAELGVDSFSLRSPGQVWGSVQLHHVQGWALDPRFARSPGG